ncbi:hypothetical protein BN988_03820 [Oceanobacillus picturae]|uniref:Transposase n=1 Tax=Oceanobacillus picturae TaxID=171693 RepID=W9BFR1_9BACI|nr:hypothetical protein [Oceanobacillus picturae]CDO05230.1 hypothetical protein BN988_03820 [Oceanobacillus picturae]
MIQAERINTMIAYPKETQCFCGEKAHLKHKTVANKFEDRVINVINVPVYECSSLHNKMARVTRVKLKSLLKEAYNLGKYEIEYKN